MLDRHEDEWDFILDEDEDWELDSSEKDEPALDSDEYDDWDTLIPHSIDEINKGTKNQNGLWCVVRDQRLTEKPTSSILAIENCLLDYFRTHILHFPMKQFLTR